MADRFEAQCWSVDPANANARLHVWRDDDDGCATLADEDCTSRGPDARVLYRGRVARIYLVRSEVAWLRDVLTALLARWPEDPPSPAPSLPGEPAPVRPPPRCG